MQYFLLMPGDGEADALNEANLLGEASFSTFWGGKALTTLMMMVDQQPELLPLVRIKGDNNKTFTVEGFLSEIRNLKVRL